MDQPHASPPRPRALLAGIGCLLIIGGGLLAHGVQTAGGVDVQDIRIPLEDGRELSALLHVPQDATEATPASGVLAVHGYINSRETQGGFAVEFARRGHVVLAIDQTGHGFSSPPAFADGYGGPAALAYLRSLPFVDSNRIGLEGHSMGGWASQAAAVAHPDGYRSIALVGSSTGTAGAPPGTAGFPRNLAVVFSRYDEFARLMWGVENAADVASSPKLQEAFGVETEIEPGRVYGSIEDGTARRLTIPNTTHPGDHLSGEAIADAVYWMNQTLEVDSGLADMQQTWLWKEIGTGIAMLGGLLLLLGAFELLLGLGWFRPLAMPAVGGDDTAGPAWWLLFTVTAALPALTYLPFTGWGGSLRASGLFPQGITNQIMVWAVGNGLLALALMAAVRVLGRRGAEAPGDPTPRARPAHQAMRTSTAAVICVATVYVAVALSGKLLNTDFRFWVVALKPMAPHHWSAFLAYLVPFTAFFYVSQYGLHSTLTLGRHSPAQQYATGIAATAGGMLVMTLWLYGSLFATGHLPVADALFSIIGIQFVPVLAATGVISVFAWRRTNGILAGALMCGLLVTWYVVAGQATHV